MTYIFFFIFFIAGMIFGGIMMFGAMSKVVKEIMKIAEDAIKGWEEAKDLNNVIMEKWNASLKGWGEARKIIDQLKQK